MESDSLTAGSAALIAALRDPAHYPHPVERIDVLETHISWVILTGRYAYKIKIPSVIENSFIYQKIVGREQRIPPSVVTPKGGIAPVLLVTRQVYIRLNRTRGL